MGILFVILILAIVAVIKAKNATVILKRFLPENSRQNFRHFKTADRLILESPTATQAVEIATSTLSEATPMERADFSGFKNFPILGPNDGKIVEQSEVLFSLDKSQAIVTISTYAGNEDSQVNETQSAGLLSSNDYLCSIDEKKCAPTDILKQNYHELEQVLQNENTSLFWSAWDSEKKILLGYLSLNDLGDSSPVYVCSTDTKNCSSTKGFNSLDNNEVHAVVPDNAFSPDLDKFVMIKQNDKPNEETGTKWELLLYDTENLSNPAKIIDLSMIIDHDPNVAYDSVQSVSWSGDEKKLAIGTSRRIFLLDLETESLGLVYIAPTNKEGDYYWDTSSLYLTPDAKFVALLTSPNFASESNENSNGEEELLNVLKKIELAKNNVATVIYSGKSLTVKTF